MMMISSWKMTFAALGVVVMLIPVQAMSAEWTRETRSGGQITRSVTKDGNIYSGQTSRVGPNGATYTSSSACRDGIIDRCRRSYSATGRNGQIFSGNSVTARGPYRVRSAGVHEGPVRDVRVVRRHWR
ncbi:hypothetical protein [Phyllobacterium ifriqiyense]|uniref:hypothetical protein n=1 Tax=Phyllobacterium ifriqiyense TaxID=314238 RepID=UPI00339B6347